MSIKKRWNSYTFGTRAFFVIWALVIIIAAGTAVGNAIDEYHFNRLPPAEQERIQEERHQAAIERARLLRENTRMARENAQNLAIREAQRRQEESDRESLLEIQRANVRACTEAATKLLPGFWPSDLAKSRIEADCAEREARSR